jgi:bacillithiol biosynthesis cysteine-adding enzyme BshC
LGSRSAPLGIESFGTTSDAIRAKLERVLDGDGVVVTTGQQPVLFLGPLYVIYKALTAIELAREIEERFDVQAVPVFWVASDDHDWDEIGQTTMVGTDSAVRGLRFSAPPGMEQRPAGPTPLPDAIRGTIDALAQMVPRSEFSKRYLDYLDRCYAPGETVGAAFANTLAEVLQGTEYAWLDSADPGLKRASRPFFETMFDDPTGTLAAMDAGDRAVRDSGHDPLIAPMPDGLPIFYDDGAARQRLRHTPDGFVAGREGTAEPIAVWKDRLEEAPERFSPSVSARPALESWLQPVCATVLGPGEIAYWSQLGPVFDHLGVPYPAIAPRSSFVVVEPRIRKILETLDLAVDDLQDDGRAAETRLTAEGRPDAVDASVSALRAAVGEGSSAMTSAIGAELPGLKGAAGKTTKALFDAIQQMDRQIDSAVRERQDVALSKVRRAAAVLWPARRRQERSLSPFYLLARYGDATIAAAREAIAEDVSRFLAGSVDGR